MEGRITFDGMLLYFLAVSFVILPLKWVLAWILASLFHELCHYLAIKCFGYKIINTIIGLGGARMETAPMRSRARLICTIAGPAGSFLLLILIRWFPFVAVCGAVQGIYNLLPLNSVDGGQALKDVLCRFMPQKQANLMHMLIRNAVSLSLLLFGVYFLISAFKLMPLLVAAMIIMKDRKKTLKKKSQEVTIVLPR